MANEVSGRKPDLSSMLSESDMIRIEEHSPDSDDSVRVALAAHMELSI